MITIKIADMAIRLDNKYPYVEALAKDFITSDEPLFTVSAADSELDTELDALGGGFSRGYAESVVLYRRIAEIIPRYDAIVFHGAVIAYNGTAYAFAARSGTGKTTHTSLWLREFPCEAHYLNGDKPIIRFINGTPYACDTPWRGKEGYGSRESMPLDSIVMLERALENSISQISAGESVIRLMKQVYVPKDAVSAQLTMRIANRLTGSVRFFELKCNMDAEAAHVCRSALVGDEKTKKDKV